MKLVKSIFWLSVAFVAIGPQVNAVDSVDTLSRQAIEGGAGMVSGQLQQIECTTLECVGTKVVISSGLDMVTDALPEQPPALDDSQIVPFPLPRLERTG